jgi:hypothetical protein
LIGSGAVCRPERDSAPLARGTLFQIGNPEFCSRVGAASNGNDRRRYSDNGNTPERAVHEEQEQSVDIGAPYCRWPNESARHGKGQVQTLGRALKRWLIWRDRINPGNKPQREVCDRHAHKDDQIPRR